jgi:hypothetical protein
MELSAKDFRLGNYVYINGSEVECHTCKITSFSEANAFKFSR